MLLYDIKNYVSTDFGNSYGHFLMPCDHADVFVFDMIAIHKFLPGPEFVLLPARKIEVLIKQDDGTRPDAITEPI